MTSLDGLTERHAVVNSRFAYIGAVTSMTGIQLITPSLPAMGEAMGLTDAQLALVTSVYLLPAALAALPAGILADRVGRRRVFGWSFVIMGLCGAALQFTSGSFAVFLAIRFIQGTAFAGVMPLTMTILGDAWKGANLIRAQGRRTVFMHSGDGSLPIIGGLLVAFGWRAPWLGQLLALPFGIAVLNGLTDPESLVARNRGRLRLDQFAAMFRSASILALQYAGFLRMFLKFGIITFLPLLLVGTRGFSPAFAGLAIGAASLTGTIPALFAGRIARLGRPTTFVFLGMAVEGLALGVMVLSISGPIIVSAALLYGVSDGLGGVFVNSFVSAATDTEQRAGFVAATGAIRNFAKFLAPATIGALTLVVPITVSFSAMAVITMASATLAIPLRALDHRLQTEGVA